MADEIGEHRIELGKALTAIYGDAQGPYTLIFPDGSTVTAPKVIMSIPHTTLRDVEINARIRDQFNDGKRSLIEDLGMASSNKVQIQFDRKFYLDRFVAPNGLRIRPNGDIYTDPGVDAANCVWDETIGQQHQNPSDKGILICFPGRNRNDVMHSTGLNVPAHNRDITEFTSQIEQAIPGAVESLTGGNKPGLRKGLASN